MIEVLLGFLGACFGSFAYAMTLRMYDRRDWVRGHSECELCHNPLRSYDLIPLLSWLSAGGRCRYCKAKIGVTYPLIEALTALLFVGSYAWWPYGFDAVGLVSFVAWLIILTCLVSLVIFDLKWFLLPDRIVAPLIATALSLQLFAIGYSGDFGRFIGIGLGIAVGSGIFLTLLLLSSGRYVGWGDVKFGVFYGLILGSGLKSMLVISIASILGTLAVLPQVVKGKTKLSSVIPFGPYLIAATIIMYLFGDRLVNLLTTTYLFP